MSEDVSKKAKQVKKRDKTVKDAFDKQQDEIIIFTPEKEGEYLIGKIVDYGISKEYNTPFLVLFTKEQTETTVFIKMGILPKFQRKKWITREEAWNESVIDAFIGSLVGFQYIGQAKAERSGREFQKYKVMFPTDLTEAGITKLE